MRLTPLSKGFIAVVVVGVVAYTYFYRPKWLQGLAPEAEKQASNVPPKIDLPTLPSAVESEVSKEAGCPSLPEVRFYHWAWNAQMGLMLATGGKQSAPNSLMCKNGVNLKLIREDNTDNMAAAMAKFAEAHKKGEAHPKDGAHFIAIMGDGSATFLKGLNDRLGKLGPDYFAVVVGSAGYSRGEDKFMGPPAWKQNPQSAKGGLVAGVLRDGDWNIALKWLGDNRIANNPDDKSYDPEALNWVAASDYLDAGEKYIAGFCADLKNTKTGQKQKRCVDGVVTWTPGDVNIAEKKGGLVSIVSTREYRSQMPNVIIGHKKWMSQNDKMVSGMLAAIFEAGDQIRESDEALQKAAAVSAVAYNEKDANYWYKYFRIQTERDKTGLIVELGGSSVANFQDNLQLFGLAPGSANVFAATYKVFGDIVKSQYPEILPGYYPVDKILDTSYLQKLQKTAGKPLLASRADLPMFEKSDHIRDVVSKRAWQIQFLTGKATFTAQAAKELDQLFNDLIVASGTLVEVRGHTDNVGTMDGNQKLSEARAFAVKEWLEKKSAANFPDGRIRVAALGQTQPVAPNTSEEGRALNRRVEIVLGTAR